MGFSGAIGINGDNGVTEVNGAIGAIGVNRVNGAIEVNGGQWGHWGQWDHWGQWGQWGSMGFNGKRAVGGVAAAKPRPPGTAIGCRRVPACWAGPRSAAWKRKWERTAAKGSPGWVGPAPSHCDVTEPRPHPL